MTPATTLAAEFAKSHGKRVDELMSTEVITAEEDTPVAEIAAILERNRIKRIPIMRGSELVGIVSQANLVQALASSAMATQDGVDESSCDQAGNPIAIGAAKVDGFRKSQRHCNGRQSSSVGTRRLGKRAHGA